nr:MULTISPECIES: glycine cleavage T C-terminal barrel domain-containing protein [Mycobacterium ulcerans group]
MSKDFIGKAALVDAAARKVLQCIVFDDPAAAALGKEPVFAGDVCIGFVTSAGYSPTIGRTIAYAWLPAESSIGDTVTVDHRGRRYPASVHQQPAVDPGSTRIRR